MNGKTLFAVTHGDFLHLLTTLLLGMCDKTTLESGIYTPENTSLTIVDFDLHTTDRQEQELRARLVAQNLNLLQKPPKSKADF